MQSEQFLNRVNLMRACMRGNTVNITELMNTGISGEAGLQICAHNGDYENVKLLISKGVNPLCVDLDTVFDDRIIDYILAKGLERFHFRD